MVLSIIFLEDKHKILLHLSIFYEYQQFFQHHICFSIQPPDYSDPWPRLARSTSFSLIVLFNYIMMSKQRVLPETCHEHWIWYLGFFINFIFKSYLKSKPGELEQACICVLVVSILLPFLRYSDEILLPFLRYSDEILELFWCCAIFFMLLPAIW
jgi:hypothetical protein